MFAVYLQDNLTGEEVCVGDMLCRSEASELRRILTKYSACKVSIIEFHYEKGRYTEV